MRKTWKKIAASVLSAVMIITGIAVFPGMNVNAAQKDVPSLTIKMSSSSVERGDTVEAEIWLNKGANTISVAGFLNVDPKVYTPVSEEPTKYGGIWKKAELPILSYDKEDGGYYIFLTFEEPPKEGGHVATVKLKVNEDAKGSGLVSFDCAGAEVGKNSENTEVVEPEVLEQNPSQTVDKTTGEVIEEGEVPVMVPLEEIHFANMNTDSLIMELGEKQKLIVEGTPVEGMLNKTVKWTSSKSKVVKVDKEGNIEAVGVGKSKVTAEVDKKKVSVTVNVNKPSIPLKGISLDKTELSLEAGKIASLKVSYKPEDTTEAKDVTWTTSDKTVATVKDGVVTAKKAGTAIITAKVGKHEATCAVKVTEKEIELTGIQLDKESLTLEEGQVSEKLNVTYFPDDTTETKDVTWTTSDKTVATVKDGVVTAKKSGTAIITANVGKHEATCAVKVTEKEIELTGIQLDKESLTLSKGQVSEKLNVTYLPDNTTEVKDVTWTTSDKTVSTVKDGIVTAGNKAGTAIITAKVGKHKATCTVNVATQTTGISLDKSEMSLVKGETSAPLTVTFEPENTDDTKEIRWLSGNDTIATVDAEGKVTGVGEGVVAITAQTKDGLHSADCIVTVTEISIDSIIIKEKVTPLEEGKTAQLAVIINPENTTDSTDVEWSSSNPKVATVENGLLKAVKAGKTTITAKVGEKVDSYELTVVKKIVSENPKPDAGNKPSAGNKPTQDGNKPNQNGAAQTGDYSNIASVMLLMISALGFVVAIVTNKTKKVRK